MQKIKIGFLPLYIKLYDDTSPELRPRLEKFYEQMADALEKRGLEVIRTPFCRIQNNDRQLRLQKRLRRFQRRRIRHMKRHNA